MAKRNASHAGKGLTYAVVVVLLGAGFLMMALIGGGRPGVIAHATKVAAISR